VGLLAPACFLMLLVMPASSSQGKTRILMRRLRTWPLAFTLIFATWALAQQITGSIRGTVQDPTGAVVRDAQVTATQVETGLSRMAMTDREGRYVLVELPVGHYRLEVSAKDFRKYAQSGITLNVNETATLPVHLAVGAEVEKIEVMADAQLIQNTVTSLGKTVLQRELVDLPRSAPRIE